MTSAAIVPRSPSATNRHVTAAASAAHSATA